MPLRDHFHEPLSAPELWEAINGGWAFVIAQRLNAHVLPERNQSIQQTHFGPRIEIDVATYENREESPSFDWNGDGDHGGVATAIPTKTEVFAPPAPPVSGFVSLADPDLFEIRLFKQSGGWKLVAAIELISPANKDRPEHRRAFATKVASYLQQGVSVVTVDIVTDRTANLHEELVRLLELPENFAWAADTGLSAITYRLVKNRDRERLDVWPHRLAIATELPTVPLWLEPRLAVPLELELTYTTTCESLRIR